MNDIETIQEMDETTEPVKRSGEIADGVFEFGEIHDKFRKRNPAHLFRQNN